VAELVVLALPAGPAFVTALRRVWDRGDAAFPLDLRLPPAARDDVLRAMAPHALIDSDGVEHRRQGGPTLPHGDALVVATSGTTGTPKGVVLTHEAVVASARATSVRLGVAADDHWLACLPLAHIGGLSVVTRALALGTALTVLPGFDAEAVTAAARRGCTLVSLVATAMARIDPADFRVVVLGGARPPAIVPPNAVVTYGSTETGSGIVYDGVALDGVEVELDDDGAIRVRGSMLLRAYRDGHDPKDANGWLDTGDLGSFIDGRLVVHGRRDDLVITGGENVWPDRVEAALLTAVGVADVAVAGVDDGEWGQRVVAYVVPAETSTPPTLADLRAAVKAVLPAFCAPRQLVLVDHIPRTTLGKVRRGSLSP